MTGLAVRKEQETFVSSVAESLAQAYVYSDNAYPFGVYEDDTLVGFIMMGYYEAKHYYTLWKFLIDQRYQYKGYGRQALELGLAYIRGKFNSPDINTAISDPYLGKTQVMNACIPANSRKKTLII